MDEYEKFIKKMIKTMKNNHDYHGQDNEETCKDEECLGCHFEREFNKVRK